MTITNQQLEQIATYLTERKANENKRTIAWARAKRDIYDRYSPRYEERAHKLAQGAGEIGKAILHWRNRQAFTEDEADTVKAILDDILAVVQKYEPCHRGGDGQ